MFKIMIDAGHGFQTPGKRSPDGMREFEFNHDVAATMKQAFLAYEGVEVYLAHEQSRDVPLKERTDQANLLQVDVFVSIHANAFRGVMGNHGGIETYVHETRPKKADMLARVIQRALVEETGLRNRGVKTADFHVLRETKMTAILIEHGFMDSYTDLPQLKLASFRKLCGEVNARTIAKFYKLKKHASALADQPRKDTTLYTVQVGAFRRKEYAEQLAKKLKVGGYGEVFIKKENRTN